MKRCISLLLAIALVFSFAGCSVSKNETQESERITAKGTKKHAVDIDLITDLPGEEVKVVTARYYSGIEISRYEIDFVYENLDESKIEEFDQALRNIRYHKVDSFAPDSSRGDRGLELLLDNGKYLICDGSRLVMSNEPVDSKTFSDTVNCMCAIQVTGNDFWKLMEQYFETVDDYVQQ